MQPFIFLSKIYSNKKLLLTLIFIVSIFVSSLFLFLFGKVGPSLQLTPGTDYLTFYEPVAESILQGKGITLKGELAIRYPPGYPIILSAIFGLAKLIGISKVGLVTVFNILITAGAVCFLFLIADLIFNKRIALFASFLWLSYPFNLWFVRNPNSEVPFLLLLFASLWLFLLAVKNKNWRLIFLSGIILGLSVLVRPIGLLLPFIVIPFVFLLIKEKSKKLPALLSIFLLAGSFLVILPWEGYAYSAAGKFIPLSTGGAPSIVDGLAFAAKPGAGGDQAILSPDITTLMKQVRAANLTSFSEIAKFLLKKFTDRPVTLMKLIGWKAARSWYATSQMWWETKILLVQLIYLIPGLFGIIYVFKRHKEKIRDIIFLLTVMFYFWLMTISVLSIMRYMVPAMGIVIIFSAITINLLINKFFLKTT